MEINTFLEVVVSLITYQLRIFRKLRVLEIKTGEIESLVGAKGRDRKPCEPCAFGYLPIFQSKLERLNLLINKYGQINS